MFSQPYYELILAWCNDDVMMVNYSFFPLGSEFLIKPVPYLILLPVLSFTFDTCPPSILTLLCLQCLCSTGPWAFFLPGEWRCGRWLPPAWASMARRQKQVKACRCSKTEQVWKSHQHTGASSSWGETHKSIRDSCSVTLQPAFICYWSKTFSQSEQRTVASWGI